MARCRPNVFNDACQLQGWSGKTALHVLILKSIFSHQLTAAPLHCFFPFKCIVSYFVLYTDFPVISFIYLALAAAADVVVVVINVIIVILLDASKNEMI